MLSSAMNFALGFFGWPLEGQYQQSITIEENGVCHELHLTRAHLTVPSVLVVQQYTCSSEDVQQCEYQ